MRCDQAGHGCRWPDTHDDHFEWVRLRWGGRCSCGHTGAQHWGLSPHECASCDCVSFYPLEGRETPTRAEVLAADALEHSPTPALVA